MIWFYLPKLLVSFINFVGVLTIAFYLAKISIAFKTKLVTKQWPRNPQEYKYFLLQQENIRLSNKIDALEQENAEMLNSIIKQLKG